MAADLHGVGLRVVQPEQRADDGGLAGAAEPDDADAFAGGDGEREALVRRRPPG